MSADVPAPPRLRLTLLLTGLALLGVGLFAAWGVAFSRRSTREVARAQEVLGQAASVERDLLLARVHHRNYLLTADVALIDSVRLTSARADTAIGRLRVLVADDSEQAGRVAALHAAAHDLADFRERVLGLRREGLAPALALLESADGNRLRAAPAGAIEAITHAETEALTTRLAREHRAGLALVVAIVLALGLAAGLGWWTVHSISRDARKLAASEARYRELAEQSPDATWVLQEGKIVYANPAAATLWGEPGPEALLGRTLLDWLDPEDRAPVAARIAAVEAGEPTPAPRPVRFLRRDGVPGTFEARGSRVVFGGKPGVQVAARDVTAQRSAELSLVLSQGRFHAVVDAMDEGVVMQDASGAIVLWNPAAERILGLSGDQLAGRTSMDTRWRATDGEGRTLPGEQHHGMIALRSGRPSSGLMGVERGPGDRVWIDVHAVPLFRPEEQAPYAVTATFTDVTAFRESAQRLAESEARYRLLAENSADLISRRSPDNRFEYASPSHEAVLGWAPEELVGGDAYALVHPEDVERLRAGPAARVARGVASPPFALRVRHKAGHYVWLESVATPVVDAAGRVTGHTVAARDITARRALEEELRRSERMDAMGRMAGGVAHDINNLLTVIRSAADLVAVGEAGQQELADLGSAVGQAAALTTQLLAFARLQQATPRPLGIGTLASHARPLMERLAGPGTRVELTVDAEAAVATVHADPLQLERVLLNLVSNARDAMGGTGVVRVNCGVASVPRSQAHAHGSLPAGEFVTLTVEDTGPGMSGEVLQHLFEPFFTTKPPGVGTGLGLASAYGLVQQAGGTVTVASSPGAGSRFVVYWPRATVPGPVPAMVPAPARMGASPEATLTGSLLLIDDEPAVRRLVSRLLQSRGYRVTTVNSGAQALQLMADSPERPDAIITDMRMPGMSGVQLVETMQRRGIHVPVLFISGQPDAPIPGDWAVNIPWRFLPKPFAHEELFRVLRELVGEG